VASHLAHVACASTAAHPALPSGRDSPERLVSGTTMCSHPAIRQGKPDQMLTRRTLLATAAAGVTAPSIARPALAATPANILVMAKAIDSIVGAFDPAESYETAKSAATSIAS
jgi:hypothetical protein